LLVVIAFSGELRIRGLYNLLPIWANSGALDIGPLREKRRQSFLEVSRGGYYLAGRLGVRTLHRVENSRQLFIQHDQAGGASTSCAGLDVGQQRIEGHQRIRYFLRLRAFTLRPQECSPGAHLAESGEIPADGIVHSETNVTLKTKASIGDLNSRIHFYRQRLR